MAEGQTIEQDIADLRNEILQARQLLDTSSKLDAISHALEGVVGLLQAHQAAIGLIRAEIDEDDQDDVEGPSEAERPEEPDDARR